MNFKKISITLLVAGCFTLATFAFSQITQTPFANETDEDIKEALVNLPERVPYGPEVATLAGQQISLGSLKQDFAINQEIYDDILNIQRAMINLMEMILNTGIKPSSLTDIEIGFSTVFTLLTNAGIRYNLSNNFAIQVSQLRNILNNIRNAPQSSDFMLLKVQLEVILAEIENILTTKLVR